MSLSLASPLRPSGDALPVAVLLLSCVIWGLMWWPLKHFAAWGLEGAPLTLLAYGGVGLLGAPLLWRDRGLWSGQRGRLLALGLAGGFANSAFVQALMLGEVVRVTLLFYLSPVWAVLGGWLFLGERLGAGRIGALGLALFGAFLVLGADPALFSRPLAEADVLALLSGLAFAVNNLCARAADQVPVRDKAVAAFLGCALASAVVLITGLAAPAWPDEAKEVAGVAGFAFGWALLATLTWQYGVSRLEAGRAAVILVAELLVAVLSAVLLGAAALDTLELLGAALILVAALVEAVSGARPAPAAPAAPHLACKEGRP